MNTLIEKLEQQRDSYFKDHKDYRNKDSEMRAWGVEKAIEIVEEHSAWRKMPSDEKPRDMQAYNLLLKNDSSEYPTLYSVGLFRQYAGGHVWLCLDEAGTYIDESKILAWQPMNTPSDEFFESLEQPTSEVRP